MNRRINLIGNQFGVQSVIHAMRVQMLVHVVAAGALLVTLPLFGQIQSSAGQPGSEAKGSDAVNEQYRRLESLASFLRNRNAKQFVINSAKGVDEASYVRIGGIEQWVTIRGQDRSNPVFLFLHGGPGDVTNPWAFITFAPWETHFTVVQWDQRGAGRTLRKTGPGVASTMTLDRMAQDGIELTEYLRQRLGRNKIIVVAHSFGTILGLRMVRVRPDPYYAYVGTGQVADETKNYSAAYDALVKKARDTKNFRALNELKSIAPLPTHPAMGTKYNGNAPTASKVRSNSYLERLA